MCYKRRMSNTDEKLNDAIAQMEHHPGGTVCALPMTAMLAVAKILRAKVQLDEMRDDRLRGEITERSQRQLEITGRLAALERRDPDRMAFGLATHTEIERHEVAESDAVCAAIAIARKHAVECDIKHAYMPSSHEDARGWMPHSWVVDAIMAVRRDTQDKNAKIRDLEAQVAAQQQAIDDVWALVELTDGYGSPFWAEPGLDDTTPAQAVAAVLEHLRQFSSNCLELMHEMEITFDWLKI